jgi:acetyl-CoA carboxylase carboxyl transferase subunit alpha
VIIEEPAGGAHNDPELAAEKISEYLFDAVKRKSQIPIDVLLEQRYTKFRKIGEFTEIPV